MARQGGGLARASLYIQHALRPIRVYWLFKVLNGITTNVVKRVLPRIPATFLFALRDIKNTHVEPSYLLRVMVLLGGTKAMHKRRSYMKNVMKFLKNKSGATAIEYGLIAALIAVAVIGGVTSL